ncbi:c-type cytochrome [Aureivirga sp. CE67]|uniref:c-type cytochrome n=1 Tax=Aureivirga sp. CE67 TaxID=1788983 RepID=UPI001E4FB10F|nr:c-type cytochrome [Aureivirga sp. CE67]
MKSVNQHSPLSKLMKLSFAFLLFFTINLSAQQGDATKGKQLFNSNCAACHKLDKKLIGPPLKGVTERRSNEWLQAWIKDNQALIKSGDADAKDLFEEYNKMPMQAFPQLSEQDINDILAYTDGKPAAKAETVAAGGGDDMSQSPEVLAGKKIFNTNCAACHKLDKKLVGPALGGITDKRETDWLKAWIKDNAALRASGDALAKEVFEENGGAPMTAFPQLSDEDLNAILAYTKYGGKKEGDEKEVVEETAKKTPFPWQATIAAVVLLVFLIWAFTKNKNGFVKFLSLIVVLIGGAWFAFSYMMQVGVDQDYQPIQPIAFSHKIHAGDNKIDCQYCHSSAKHSKTSGIPSVNVCMNCHKNITEYEGPVTTEHDKAFYDGEIQKIYDAIGFDPETRQYIENYEQKPIEWVRIHNLPDFAYYNHSQHVNVAGIKCQKCHGPVETMDEVYQYSPLTMGWCVDCHRETEVDMTKNGYYKKIHEQLAKKYGVVKVTEAQMGGLECGKCHY